MFCRAFVHSTFLGNSDYLHILRRDSKDTSMNNSNFPPSTVTRNHVGSGKTVEGMS